MAGTGVGGEGIFFRLRPMYFHELVPGGKEGVEGNVEGRGDLPSFFGGWVPFPLPRYAVGGGGGEGEEKGLLLLCQVSWVEDVQRISPMRPLLKNILNT